MEQQLTPRPMTIDEFEPLVGQPIQVDCSPETVDLTLVQATPLPDRGGAARTPFSLIFQSDSMVQLVSGMYAMKAEQFGPALIYIETIMPATDAAPGNYYQAVFN